MQQNKDIHNKITVERLRRPLQTYLRLLRWPLCALGFSVMVMLMPPQVSLANEIGATRPIAHGDSAKPLIALTFDACQTAYQKAGFDAAIVDELIRTQTPATFFLGGLWMQSHPTATVMLANNALFELGNHSWSHPDFNKITVAKMQSEIEKTQAKMQTLTGHQTTLFRFPYGRFNPTALQALTRLGLTAIQWSVVSGDPGRSDTATRMDRIVTKRVRNGSIIIMHVNGRGWHTAEALPKIIADLKAMGYTFVTVSELLKQQTPVP